MYGDGQDRKCRWVSSFPQLVGHVVIVSDGEVESLGFIVNREICTPLRSQLWRYLIMVTCDENDCDDRHFSSGIQLIKLKVLLDQLNFVVRYDLRLDWCDRIVNGVDMASCITWLLYIGLICAYGSGGVLGVGLKCVACFASVSTLSFRLDIISPCFLRCVGVGCDLTLRNIGLALRCERR